jgi:hypothetical protein
VGRRAARRDSVVRRFCWWWSETVGRMRSRLPSAGLPRISVSLLCVRWASGMAAGFGSDVSSGGRCEARGGGARPSPRRRRPLWLVVLPSGGAGVGGAPVGFGLARSGGERRGASWILPDLACGDPDLVMCGDGAAVALLCGGAGSGATRSIRCLLEVVCSFGRKPCSCRSRRRRRLWAPLTSLEAALSW